MAPARRVPARRWHREFQGGQGQAEAAPAEAQTADPAHAAATQAGEVPGHAGSSDAVRGRHAGQATEARGSAAPGEQPAAPGAAGTLPRAVRHQAPRRREAEATRARSKPRRRYRAEATAPGKGLAGIQKGPAGIQKTSLTVRPKPPAPGRSRGPHLRPAEAKPTAPPRPADTPAGPQDGVARIVKVVRPSGERGPWTSADLLIQTAMQFNGAVDRAAAQRLIDRKEVEWTGEPVQPSPVAHSRGYLLLNYRDRTMRPTPEADATEMDDRLAALSGDERHDVRAEAARRFTDRTGLDIERSLGRAVADAVGRAYLRELTFQVLRDRSAIDHLPDAQRRFLFPGDGTAVAAKDYATVLRVAGKIGDLSPEQLETYTQSTVRQAASWRELESSVDAYRLRIAVRQAGAEHHRRASERIAGLDAAYGTMREAYAALAGDGRMPHGDRLDAMQSDLEARGFADVDDFRSRGVRELVGAVKEVALSIAQETIDRQQHLLWTERARYRERPDEARAVAERLADGVAARHFDAAAEHVRSAAQYLRMGMSWLAEREKATAAAERRTAEGLVLDAARGHPAVRLPGFDLARLARTPADRVVDMLIGDMDARDRAIERVRQELRDNPDRVFEMDTLMASAARQRGIAPGSLDARIIEDHVRDQRAGAADRKASIGVLLAAASLFSGGIALLAAGATAAFGLHDIDTAVHDFAVGESLYTSGLTGQEPSSAVLLGTVLSAVGDVLFSAADVVAAGRAASVADEAGDAARAASHGGGSAAERRLGESAGEGAPGPRDTPPGVPPDGPPAPPGTPAGGPPTGPTWPTKVYAEQGHHPVMDPDPDYFDHPDAGFHYVVDQQDRPLFAEGWAQDTAAPRHRDQRELSEKMRGGEVGLDSAHGIGARFGGDGRWFNLSPVQSEVNRVAMAGFENAVGALQDAGERVFLQSYTNYNIGMSDQLVPSSVQMRAFVLRDGRATLVREETFHASH